MIAGIDYGSKRAGTTAVCLGDLSSFRLLTSSRKDSDADKWLQELLQQYQPAHVFLDAPLSLPLVYKGKGNEQADYFYRRCDRELRAMSPLFLGGLTARAMLLAAWAANQKIQFIEVYPGGLAKLLELAGYKQSTEYIKNSTDGLDMELQMLGHEKSPPCKNWHEVDAVLAYISGVRFYRKLGQAVGDPREGVIYI